MRCRMSPEPGLPFVPQSTKEIDAYYKKTGFVRVGKNWRPKPEEDPTEKPISEEEGRAIIGTIKANDPDKKAPWEK